MVFQGYGSDRYEYQHGVPKLDGMIVNFGMRTYPCVRCGTQGVMFSESHVRLARRRIPGERGWICEACQPAALADLEASHIALAVDPVLVRITGSQIRLGRLTAHV